MPAANTTTDPDKPTAGRLPAARKAQARSRVSNGRDVLPGVDNRTMIARRFYDVCQALISDQAGLDCCSEARLQLIRRFAAAAVMAEEMEARLARGESIDVAEHALLSSTLVRLAARIGINRRLKPITPDLHDYLEVTTRTTDDEEVEDEGSRR
jgi:hypothetical protein